MDPTDMDQQTQSYTHERINTLIGTHAYAHGSQQDMKYSTCFNETDALVPSQRVFVKYPQCLGVLTANDTDWCLLDLGSNLLWWGYLT